MQELSKSLEVARLFQQIVFLHKQNMGKLFEDLGITAPEGMVVGILARQKKMKITELSNKLGLSNSTMSGIVDRLEKREVVIRERSKEDKRVVYVSISPNFDDVHQEVHERLEKNTERIVNRGTREELDKVYEGLIILKKLLSENLND